VQANTQSQRFCSTFNFTQPHQSPPTTLQVDRQNFETIELQTTHLKNVNLQIKFNKLINKA